MQEKGYFYISDENNWGGSGPFDKRLEEVLEQAEIGAIASPPLTCH